MGLVPKDDETAMPAPAQVVSNIALDEDNNVIDEESAGMDPETAQPTVREHSKGFFERCWDCFLKYFSHCCCWCCSDNIGEDDSDDSDDSVEPNPTNFLHYAPELPGPTSGPGVCMIPSDAISGINNVNNNRTSRSSRNSRNSRNNRNSQVNTATLAESSDAVPRTEETANLNSATLGNNSQANAASGETGRVRDDIELDGLSPTPRRMLPLYPDGTYIG
jgi:hypothetical protein